MEFAIKKHSDGFVAYPLGLRGVVVGRGDTHEAALANAQSVAAFHIVTFGSDAIPATVR